MMFKPFGHYSQEIFVLILFAASWLLLRLEGKGLDALGFNQPRRRLVEFAVGFCIFGGASAISQFGLALLGGVSWEVNHSFIVTDYFKYLVRPQVTTALLVALVFQGYLLFQLLRFAGPTRALLISGVAFGLFCWFMTEGSFAEAGAMIVVFLCTGAFGFVLALAFRQTGSLAAPIGLSFGWLFVSRTIFGGWPTDAFELLVLPPGVYLEPAGVTGGLFGLGVPIIALALVTWLLYRKGLTKGQGSWNLNRSS